MSVGESEFPSATSSRGLLDIFVSGLFWSIGLGTILVSLWVHRLAGFTFPNPWNDEPWMLWGAVSFMEKCTPFSEYLNYARPIFAFPAYGVALGTLFKFTGFSFALARWTSWIGTMLAYLAVLRIARRQPFAPVAALVASLFFLGASAVIAGNMARPEAFVLLLAASAFCLLAEGQVWKGLAVSAGCGIFHVVGVFFFLGAAGTVAASALRERRLPRPARADWVFVAGAAVLVLAHFAVIATHWNYYLTDTRATVQVDSPGNSIARIFSSNMTPWYAVAVALGLFFLWKDPRRLPWIAFGGIGLLIPGLREQMWYDVYLQMGFLMLALALPLAGWLVVSMALRRWPAIPARFGQLARAAAYFALLGGMLLVCYRNGRITGPNHYPQKLEWGWGMRFDAADYMQPADVAAIAKALEPYANQPRTYRIYFMPDADALFIQGRFPANVIPYQAIWTDIAPDLFLFRRSRHFPDWWRIQYVEKAAQRFGLHLDQPFHSRDGTESWYLVDASAHPAANSGPAHDEPLGP